MLIPLEWFCGCALLLTFKCAIFANTNSVELTFRQILIMWIGWIPIDRYGQVWMYKIYLYIIPSQISSFCGSQTDFSKFMIKPHWVKLFLTNSFSYVISQMRGEGRGYRTVVNKYADFLSLPLSKIFTGERITLIKINATELRLKGRTMNKN